MDKAIAAYRSVGAGTAALTPTPVAEIFSLEGALARPNDPKRELPTQFSEIITRPYELMLVEHAWRMLADWLDERGWSDPRNSPFARNLNNTTAEFRQYADRIRAVREVVELAPDGDRVVLMNRLTPQLMELDDHHISLHCSLGEYLGGQFGEFSMLRAPINSDEEFMQRMSFLSEVMDTFVVSPWQEFYGRKTAHLHSTFEKGPNHERHLVKIPTALGTLMARLEFEDPPPIAGSFLAHVPYPYESALFISMTFKIGGALSMTRWRHAASYLMRYSIAYGDSFLPRFEGSKGQREQVRSDFETVIVPGIKTILDVVGSFRDRGFNPYSRDGYEEIRRTTQRYVNPAAHQLWNGPHKLHEWPPMPTRKTYEGFPYDNQRYRCPELLTPEGVRSELAPRFLRSNYYPMSG